MTSLNKWDTSKFDNALKRLETLCKKELQWGFFENSVYSESHSNKEAAGLPVAQVAYWNENGSRLAPPRPFFTASIVRIVANPDTNEPWKCKQQVCNIIDATIKNGRNVAPLNALGKMLADDLKEKIGTYGLDAGDENPRNAPAWAARKGHDQPLIESGTMHDSVEYKIAKAGSV